MILVLDLSLYDFSSGVSSSPAESLQTKQEVSQVVSHKQQSIE